MVSLELTARLRINVQRVQTTKHVLMEEHPKVI